MSDCNRNTDPQKLVREGTSQEQRPFVALDPAYAPVSEQTPAHSMVFAQAYSAYLRYFDTGNVAVDDWQRFFSQDVSVQLAVAAVQNVDDYRTTVKQYFDFLNNLQNDSNAAALRDMLDFLFSAVASLALRLDELKEALPEELPLKKSLRNLIVSQLAPAFARLIAYREGGWTITDLQYPTNILADEETAPLALFGQPAMPFSQVKTSAYSGDWSGNVNWATYYTSIAADDSVFGNPLGPTVFDRANHIATHNLFTSIFDQFLKAFARVVNDAKLSLESTFSGWDSHEPHYALFLAFLRLFEHTRAEMNTLTGRHLDYYYKDILRLKEKPAEPGHVHLLVELAKHAAAHQLPPGELFKAGKDALGNDAFFASDRDFIANQAKVAALKTVYRHRGGAGEGNGMDTGRLYASPVANSDDGSGAELLSADKSWHPFYNKVYDDGALTQIKMPKAEVGFAIASHHFYLTEGYRKISIEFNLKQPFWAGDVFLLISYTTEKGWHTIEKEHRVTIGSFENVSIGGIPFPLPVPVSSFAIPFDLEADAPAVTPWSFKVHGGNYDTEHPVVRIVLKHKDDTLFNSSFLEGVLIKNCTIKVAVGSDFNGNPLTQPGLKNLAVNTDFGSVDLSKPFQPFGPIPESGAALVIGHKEVFQKSKVQLKLKIGWKGTPTTGPTLVLRDLAKGIWELSPSNPSSYTLLPGVFGYKVQDSARSPVDYTPNEVYSVEKTSGYLKVSLNSDFGHKNYPTDLANYVIKKVNKETATQPTLPYTPEIESLSLCYTAVSEQISLDNSGSKDPFGAKFYHIGPFGMAERHPALSGGVVSLLPQFQHYANGHDVLHEAELYIGVSDLKPPQNLALLFQIAEGTADPLSAKPSPHLHWSYLRDNNWATFEKDAVEDLTGELTRSGIVALAMPRDASDDNTLLPAGMYWIRVAVEKESDTVCRCILVAAQALRATFADRDNDPAFSATPLEAGVISKLEQPDSAVKKIEQPFATFGGRGKEDSADFYTRVSERLRHKDRSIALWDYERLVLEAFPQIYKVKCLNHTQYEPNESGTGIYRELAPGHVTVVTIPNQQFQNLRDPLRPYTSLGLLLEIEEFLRGRLSCFARLHVKNPQFEELQVNFKVRFFPGFDETFYTNKLKREITRYLSPWAFPGGGSPSFGGKIYKSVLINFVEEQPYVDYVTDFQLFHYTGGKKTVVNLNEVEGSTAVSILVSVPEEKHRIQPITVAEAPALTQVSGEDCSCEK